ncbi:MAG: hypothetical protein IPF92_19295 [Myxococcales bacterium]|nr:hypothetical protein [Myxococcales bacterium]
MTKGVHPDARAYVREVFAELLRSRSQRELAHELDVHQSRVSTALNVGRVAPETLERAAALAGRSPEEVRDALSTIGPGLIQQNFPGVPTAARVTRHELSLEPAVLAVKAYVPNATPDEAAIVASALQRWGMPPEGYIVREAAGTIARLRARLEQARELERLRWTLDHIRVDAPKPEPRAADSDDSSPDDDR